MNMMLCPYCSKLMVQETFWQTYRRQGREVEVEVPLARCEDEDCDGNVGMSSLGDMKIGEDRAKARWQFLYGVEMPPATRGVRAQQTVRSSIKLYGTEAVLIDLIDALAGDEDYVEQLRADLGVALKNYQNRYNDEDIPAGASDLARRVTKAFRAAAKEAVDAHRARGEPVVGEDDK